MADLGLRRIRVLSEQRDAGHHHPWRAETALEPVFLPETFLDRMELAVLLESFDGRDLTAVRLHGEHGARLHRLVVEMTVHAPQCVVSQPMCVPSRRSSRRKWTSSRRESTCLS